MKLSTVGRDYKEIDVSDDLGDDNELVVSIAYDSVYLNKGQVIELIAHLQKVIIVKDGK